MSQPLLTASQILEAKDLAEDIVEVPKWGGSVRLVQMTAGESLALTKEMSSQEHTDNGMFLMLVYSARNENNERIFTVDDVEKLKEKNFDILNMLQYRALKLNKQTPEELEALKKA